MGYRTFLVVVIGLFLASPLRAGSETPPKGPPWVRDILTAQKLALEDGKPILFYFTKTY